MSPSPRLGAAIAVLAVLALAIPGPVVLLLALALATATIVDLRSARRPPTVEVELETVLSRGVATRLIVRVASTAGEVRVRQAVTPDLELTPSEADGTLDGVLVPRRRGRHEIPPPTVRTTGPLGLGRWDRVSGERRTLLVYPDMEHARRLAGRVRHGRFRDEGVRVSGPLGLGTEFESVRDYSPDDDVRQVNWRATARLERPMSNQFRVDRDRDVLCVVDAGRLMAAPLGDRTRLDAALDAVSALALVADDLGDRCGAVAFDASVLRHLAPRRSGGKAVIKTLFDLEASGIDSDYELAFRTIASAKRAFVLVLTDLIDEAAARSLVSAVPVLARRHSVTIATATDGELRAAVSTRPERVVDVYAASIAVEVLAARQQVAAKLTRAGAHIVEARPDSLPTACVMAYLRSKARALA